MSGLLSGRQSQQLPGSGALVTQIVDPEIQSFVPLLLQHDMSLLGDRGYRQIQSLDLESLEIIVARRDYRLATTLSRLDALDLADVQRDSRGTVDHGKRVAATLGGDLGTDLRDDRSARLAIAWKRWWFRSNFWSNQIEIRWIDKNKGLQLFDQSIRLDYLNFRLPLLSECVVSLFRFILPELFRWSESKRFS